MAYNYVHVAQRFSAKMKVSDLMMDPIGTLFEFNIHVPQRQH